MRELNVYQKIVEEFDQLLSNRGYLEVAINSTDKPETLLGTFHRYISLALFEPSNRSTPFCFSLETSGCFGKNQIISFRLYFVFDVANQSLAITQLDLSSKGVQKSIALKSSYDLPHACNAPRLLKELLDIFSK